MKISIFSFAVNDKFPIDIMQRQFAKYIKEDFDFILFNDANNSKMEENINTITSYNKINCVRVPQNIHSVNTINNPSEAYASTLNWAVHDYAVKNNCEIIVLLHTDVFPVCEISVLDIIGNKSVASVTEFRLMNGKGVNYFYPALTIINMKRLNDANELDFGLSPGLDTGGNTKNFIENNPNSVKFMANHQTSYFIATLNNNEPIGEYLKTDLAICRAHGLSAGWIADGFYHHMAGSQWNASNPTFAEGHRQRMDLFLKYFY